MKNTITILVTNALVTLLIVTLFMNYTGARADSDLNQETQSSGNLSVLSGTFTYQGVLRHQGDLVYDNCNFQFSFFDAAVGGAQIGSTQTVTNVTVAGTFAVELDAGTLFEEGASHLQIRVDCGDGFTTLAPRQTITGAPYAHTLRPGATISGDGVASLVIENSYGDALQLNATGFDSALQINSVGDGIYIGSSGEGVHINAPVGRGVFVNHAGGDGIYVNDAGEDGVVVKDAGNDGVQVTGAGGDGIDAQTVSSNHYAGRFVNAATFPSAGDGLYAKGNDDSANDLVLGGESSSSDNGVISTDPAYPGSDLVVRTNDSVYINLDRDGNGEDADFIINNKDGQAVFQVDESGDVFVSYDGELDWAGPYAMGSIRFSGDTRTSNTVVSITGPSVGITDTRYDINLRDFSGDCDDPFSPKAMILLTTMEPEAGNFAKTYCDGSDLRAYVAVPGTPPPPQFRFSFVVYRLDGP